MKLSNIRLFIFIFKINSIFGQSFVFNPLTNNDAFINAIYESDTGYYISVEENYLNSEAVIVLYELDLTGNEINSTVLSKATNNVNSQFIETRNKELELVFLSQSSDKEVNEMYKYNINKKKLELITTLKSNINIIWPGYLIQGDSIILFSYYNNSKNTNNLCKVNISNGSSIISNKFRHIPMNIEQLDNSNYLIKGLFGFEFVDKDSLNSRMYYLNDSLGSISGDLLFDRFDSTFVNSGCVHENEKMTKLIDTSDIAISINNNNFEVVKFKKFNFAVDTSEAPAIYESIIIEKDAIVIGGTLNFDITNHPQGIQNSWLSLFKIDKNLNTIWSRRIGGDAYYLCMGIKKSNDSCILIYGTRHDFKNTLNKRDAFLIKINSSGELLFNSLLGNNRSSMDIYPNPAIDNIQIKLSDINPSSIVEIINLQGTVVFSSELKELEHSKENYKINISNLPSELYILNLKHNTVKIFSKQFLKL